MPIVLGLDLSCCGRFCDPAKKAFAGTMNESRQAGVCAGDGTSAVRHVRRVADYLVVGAGATTEAAGSHRVAQDTDAMTSKGIVSQTPHTLPLRQQ
jgi:hypothetical protein